MLLISGRQGSLGRWEAGGGAGCERRPPCVDAGVCCTQPNGGPNSSARAPASMQALACMPQFGIVLAKQTATAMQSTARRLLPLWQQTTRLYASSLPLVTQARCCGHMFQWQKASQAGKMHWLLSALLVTAPHAPPRHAALPLCAAGCASAAPGASGAPFQ